MDGGHLRLDDVDRLSSTAFDLPPTNTPFPIPGFPHFTTNYDRTVAPCYDIGEYQSIGVSARVEGDDARPIVAAWGDNRRPWTSPSNSSAPGTHAGTDVFSSRLDDEKN